MPLKYNPAGDALCLAATRWNEGNKKAALYLAAAAFDLPGISEIISGLNQINTEVTACSGEDCQEPKPREPNKLLEEEFDDQLERQVQPKDENIHPEEAKVGKSEPNPDELDSDENFEFDENEDNRRLENAMSIVLAELDENAADAETDESAHKKAGELEPEDYDGDDDDLDLEDEEEEENGETEKEAEEEEPEEDKTEEEKKVEAMLEHIAVANKVSLRGEKGTLATAKQLLKNVA